MESLAAELLKVKVYPFNNGRCGDLPLHNHPNMTYKKAAESLLQYQEHPRIVAVGLWALTRCVPQNAPHLTLPDGRSISVLDALIEAIRLDGSLSFAFNTLSARMQDSSVKKASTNIDSFIRLADGRCLGSRELLVEAIRLDPNISLFYDNLGGLMSEKDVATLYDGRKLSRNEMFVEALRLDPKDIYTYVNFASILNATKEVVIDDRKMTYKDLACEALHIDPAFGAAYYCIAAKMRDKSSEVELLGRLWTQRQLCLEAIRHSPDMYQPYTVLARTTDPEETLALHDGRVLNRFQLYIQAAKFDTTGFVMRTMSLSDKLQCLWSPAQHKAFGGKAAEVMATFLLGHQRLVSCGASEPMDPAVLEEMLSFWCLADSSDLVRAS